MFSIISAIGKNREIGQKNGLLWDLPRDMKHFRETTSGKTVVMGQRTFESIGRPLPKRRNIVLTKDENYFHEGIEIVHSLEELENLLNQTTKPEEEIFIIGGGQVYKTFIDKADKLYITHVDAEFPDADVFFPEIEESKWQKTKIEKHPKDALNEYDLEFAEYERK